MMTQKELLNSFLNLMIEKIDGIWKDDQPRTKDEVLKLIKEVFFNLPAKKVE